MGYRLHGNNNDQDHTWTYQMLQQWELAHVNKDSEYINLFMLSAHVLQSTWCAGLGIKGGCDMPEKLLQLA